MDGMSSEADHVQVAAIIHNCVIGDGEAGDNGAEVGAIRRELVDDSRRRVSYIHIAVGIKRNPIAGGHTRGESPQVVSGRGVVLNDATGSHVEYVGPVDGQSDRA